MSIADRIQHLRKTKGISQEELADKIGVSRQAVSKWESEQSIPELDKIILLSDFFEVTTDSILKGIETKGNESKDQAFAINANAIMFVYVATALNLIGVVASCAIWYEFQVIIAIAAGVVLMVAGSMIFGIGITFSTAGKESAKRQFWIINIWLLLFMPISLVYNALVTRKLAPYPLLVRPPLTFVIFWLAYLVVCSVVVLFQVRKGRK